MCQECLAIDEQMRQEAMQDIEEKPQTIDQVIFWLEIGGYFISVPMYGWTHYLVLNPLGFPESLTVDRMRSKAMDVWWQYQKA